MQWRKYWTKSESLLHNNKIVTYYLIFGLHWIKRLLTWWQGYFTQMCLQKTLKLVAHELSYGKTSIRTLILFFTKLEFAHLLVRYYSLTKFEEVEITCWNITSRISRWTISSTLFVYRETFFFTYFYQYFNQKWIVRWCKMMIRKETNIKQLSRIEIDWLIND